MSAKPSDSAGVETAFGWFCEQVYSIVQAIPKGKVTTYGGIAAMISVPAGMDPLAYKRIRARWTGYALKKCPDNIPWWRVVNRRGQISPRMGHGPHIQRSLLEEEGIPMREDGLLSLEKVLWRPAESG
jgi:methylated-DNA-protein-cysteine methyltransferase-like protein